MPYPGEVLAGVYQVVDEIGKGGAGIIYRAYHLNLHKYVVVKKIKDHYVGVLNARGEVDILKSLHHTCLPQVYDFLQIGQEIYTVMDYIDGHDLKFYIDNGYRFDEQMLWRWLFQLVDVLEYLHGRGILHTDIKPANIMLSNEGNICLIDFNISLTSEEESMTGISEVYASPEQFKKWNGVLYGTADRDISLDARTDLYSLAASFYHMMSGYRPSPVPGKMVPLKQLNLNYSESLIQILSGMMAWDRRKRYADAAQVKKSIQKAFRTKAEKRTLWTVFGLMAGSVAVLTIVCVMVILSGSGHVSQKSLTVVQNEEIRLSELCQSGDYETARQEALLFMNQEERAIRKLDGARQAFLEHLVEAEIGTGNYPEAKGYLDQLFAIEKKPEYYLSQAVIAAYENDFEAAASAIETARSLGESDASLQKSQAEILVAQKRYDEAVRDYAALYENTGSIGILRRLASLCLYAATECETENDSLNASNFAARAVSYYEALLESGMANFTDKRNLVSAYELSHLNEKAVTLLQSMLLDYLDSYQIYLELGILKYNAELQKAPAARDFSQVLEYTERAEKLSQAVNAGEDERLKDFLRVVAELK